MYDITVEYDTDDQTWTACLYSVTDSGDISDILARGHGLRSDAAVAMLVLDWPK